MTKPSDAKKPTNTDDAAARANGAGGANQPGARTPIKWDTTHLKSSYANFCNANSTREEVVLNFGVNKTWERGPTDALDIELNHRIVLSPFAAKRLTDLMQQLMKEHESRYGALPDK